MATRGTKRTAGSGNKPKGGRVTPKGGPAAARAARARSTGTTPTDSSTRYTAPLPRYAKESPPWVPIVMFTLLGLGMLTIFLNYTGLLPGGVSGWYLLPGLVFITGGIIAATSYR